MSKTEELSLPILTDVVELRASNGSTGVHQVISEDAAEQTGIHSVEELSALQADLVGRTLNLTDELLHSAARELEGVLLERVVDRLRAALPEIVSQALREHLNPRED
jgi:hypothetical protein